MKLSSPPKFGGKTSLCVRVISFCKISFPVMHLLHYNNAGTTGRSHPLIA
jgi:hypothetical protein